MRRKDREVTDERAIEEMIHGCDCCRVGFNDNGKVYIVPMNFGYVKTENSRSFYFHGAKAGRKFELIKESPEVSFEMDCGYELHPAEEACKCTAAFKCVMGSGRISIVEDEAERTAGLNAVMAQTFGGSWEFDERAMNAVCVFRLDLEELSAKEHL